DDAPRHTAAVALLAVAEDDRRELLHGVVVDDVSGALAVRAHAHVERSVVAESEAALALVELHGGDAEVEEHAVHFGDAVVVGELFEGWKGAGADPQAAVGASALPGLLAFEEGGGGGMQVDRQHVRAALEEEPGVAAGAEGRVDVPGAGSRR